MLRALVLVVVSGCGVGYQCEGPTCAVDAGATVDAGAGPSCPSTCAGGCCDEQGVCFGTSQRWFQPLSSAQCMPPDPFGPQLRRCVACAGGEVCGVLPRQVDLYGCVPQRVP